MRFAVTHPLITHPYHPALVTGAGIAAVATAAEAAGFDGFGFTDHPAPSQRWLDGGGHDALDPFVALAFAAACSSSIRLLTNLTVLPYRNPFLLAKSVATLDRLSNGRLTLGVGTGYLLPEFGALGVDFDERNDLFDEVLAGCRAAWTGSSITMKGTHFEATGNIALPTPVQDPVPVWIGGNAGITLRRVATRAQGWMPLPNPRTLDNRRRSPHLEDLDDLARLLDKLRRFRDEAGTADDPLDVLFFNLTGGRPGTTGWSLDAYAADEQAQAALGVTWNAVNCTGATPEEALDMVHTFGAEVIAPLRA
jgi:probable F420-dependent oxidoreductase